MFRTSYVQDGHVNVRNMYRPFMKKNHSKIVCIKLVHLPYLSYVHLQEDYIVHAALYGLTIY